MKRILIATVAVLGAAALVTPVLAQTPPDPPAWPAGTTQVFVSAHTLTTSGRQENFFAQGSAVVFQVYAVDLKTNKVVTAKDAKFFYVSIPGQPNVKLTYGKVGNGAKAPMLWSGTWTIPAAHPLGLVPFKVLVKTTANRVGSFVQAPVALAQLTVIAPS